jgi:hypothetical protein
MVERTWRYERGGFVTSSGVVTVRNNAICFRPTLRQFVARLLGRSQTSNWQAESARRPSLLTLGAVGAGVGLLALGVTGALADGLTNLGVLANLTGALSTLLLTWDAHLRERTVPLSSVERVTVNTRDNELTVRYEQDSLRARLLPWPESWTTGTETVELTGNRATQSVQEMLRRHGVSVDVVNAVVVDDGAHLCVSCRRQVSPSDVTCPSCGATVRPEQRETVSSHSRVESPSR